MFPLEAEREENGFHSTERIANKICLQIGKNAYTGRPWDFPTCFPKENVIMLYGQLQLWITWATLSIKES